MKGQLVFGLATSLAILNAGASSVLAQSKQIIQNLPNEKQLYAQSQSPQVASLFRPLLPQLQRETNVPILLPSDLEFFSQQRQRIYAEGRGAANGYNIGLGTAPNCRGVTACFFGYFGAERGRKPNSGKEVRLTKGITGYVQEMPRRVSQIQWIYEGVLYSIQLKADETTVIEIARSAIETGLQNSQIATGRPPSPGQQATATIRSARQTFKDVKSLGMGQFLQGNQELIAAQEALQQAAKGQYKIFDAQSIDFLKKEITKIRASDCKAIGFSCEPKPISYADYVELKLKIDSQVSIFTNGLIYDQIIKYQERLYKDKQKGGTIVAENLNSNFDRIWKNVETEQTAPSRRSLSEKLGIALEQTRDDVGNFVTSVFSTSIKINSSFYQIDEIAKSVNSIDKNTLDRIAGGPKYASAVAGILKDASEALLKFDSDKLREATLKAAQETIEFVNPEDRKVSGHGNAIKAYLAAKEIIDRDKLLRQPQINSNLDDFDKFYLATAQFSKALDVIIAGLSISSSNIKVIDQLTKKVDIFNTLLFDALDFTYKDDLRRRYVRMLYYYNRNQLAISGLASFIDSTAEEVGKYLIKARADVVSQKQDGTITVNVDGVVYPP